MNSSGQPTRYYATNDHARLGAFGATVMVMNLFWPILLWFYIPYFLIGLVVCVPRTKIFVRAPAPQEGIYGYRDWVTFISAWPYLIWLRKSGRD